MPAQLMQMLEAFERSCIGTNDGGVGRALQNHGVIQITKGEIGGEGGETNYYKRPFLIKSSKL